jgi:hypothetical protein
MESYSIFVFLVGQQVDDVDGLFTSAQRYHSSIYWFRYLARCVLLYFWYCRRVDCYISVHSVGNSVDICHVRFTSCLLVSRLHTYRLYDTFFCRPQRVMHSILSCRILLHVREKDRAMRVMPTTAHYSIN